MAEEKDKWEACEGRLVRRLEELEREPTRRQIAVSAVGCAPAASGQTEAIDGRVDVSVLSGGGGVNGTERRVLMSQPPSHLVRSPGANERPRAHFHPEVMHYPRSLPGGESSQSGPADQYSTSMQSPPVNRDTANPLSLAMLAQQLPPLPKFTGDGQMGGEEERFDEWLERGERVWLE